MRRTGKRAPGPAGVPKRSGSPVRSTRASSAPSSKARCPTAPGASSDAATGAAASRTAPAAPVGGAARVVGVHGRAGTATLAWIEANAAQTRTKDPATRRMVREGGQRMVAATFRHDTSRHLDSRPRTLAVVANRVRGGDGKGRSMANGKLHESKMLIGASYRSELARGVAHLGYGIEKTHADGRFERAGVAREFIDAYSVRRAEIEAGMAERGTGSASDSPRLAERAALMSRAARRDIDREVLGTNWRRQAAQLGFDALAPEARGADRPVAVREAVQDLAGTVPGGGADAGAAGDRARGDGGEPSPSGPGAVPDAHPLSLAAQAREWAAARHCEREAVFPRTGLLAAALAPDPGKVTEADAKAAVAECEAAGSLHAARLPGAEGLLTTDRAVADGTGTIALIEAGRERARAPMRARAVDKAPPNRPLTSGQKAAVKLILSEGDRVVGVQGYGSGTTTMFARARAFLPDKRGHEVRGLSPSASPARTLEAKAGTGAENLPRFLARHAGVAAGRMTANGDEALRARFARTALVIDEGSLASTVQARDLLRIAGALRIPRVVPVGDEKRLDAVDAGKPFAQLQAAGMKTAVMEENARARPGAERGHRGEPRGRHRHGVREARRQRRRGQARQSRGRRRRALARARAGRTRAHRPDGAQPRIARGRCDIRARPGISSAPAGRSFGHRGLVWDFSESAPSSIGPDAGTLTPPAAYPLASSSLCRRRRWSTVPRSSTCSRFARAMACDSASMGRSARWFRRGSLEVVFPVVRASADEHDRRRDGSGHDHTGHPQRGIARASLHE